MSKKHYHVFCIGVVHVRDKIERTRNLNVMLATNEGNITRGALATVQHQAGVRFKTEFDPHGKSEIKDMVMFSVINCGQMTDAEFHAGFEMPDQEGETETEEIDVSGDERSGRGGELASANQDLASPALDPTDADGSSSGGTPPGDPADGAGSAGDPSEDETRG